MQSKTKKNTLLLALYALFVALVLVMGLTPYIGYIQITPTSAITIVQIPVVIGACILGPKGGSLLGFFFGLTSLIMVFMGGDALSLLIVGIGTGIKPYNLFLIAAILFLPRILTGLVAALVYRAFPKKSAAGSVAAFTLAGLSGSLTNTVFYLGGFFLFAREIAYTAMGVDTAGALLGILALAAATNGVIEAIVSAVVCTAVGRSMKYVLDKIRL